ncbi:MAG: formate dehydrogenase subunit alpha [Gemmatimonadetes bacterium]|nr:formate dehydrogenase subunit alpha [Gemmatimonadota bacterium]
MAESRGAVQKANGGRPAFYGEIEPSVPSLTATASAEPPPVAQTWGGSIHGRPVPGVNQPRTTERVTFQLDGRDIIAEPGETILEAGARAGIEIPHLCYMDGMRADGNCRACVVEIEGERVLAPSCCRAPKAGMKVHACNDRALASQRMVIELLLADAPASPHRPDSELTYWADRLGVHGARFTPRHQPVPDFSHPGIEVRLDACIQCTRCVRACREVQVNDVIGYAGRGAHARIVFDIDDPMGESSCVGCGECVEACPTGALLPALPAWAKSGFDGNGARAGAGTSDTRGDGAPGNAARPAQPVHQASGDGRSASPSATSTPTRPAPPAPMLDRATGDGAATARSVDSLCPYCGVGCQTVFHIERERITHVTGRNGPSNWGRLCIKGRFGFDYIHHPQRLLVPLVRKPGVPKDAHHLIDPGDFSAAFREATWDEALDLAAQGLRDTFDRYGRSAMAGFGSAKGSNEEAYLFQKLMRTGFLTNNVDHCTRLCHASSVAALMECIASGAVSNQVSDVQFADVFMVIGANPTGNHPVAATFMKNAIERGARLILADPRRTDMARLATHSLQFRPDTDVALLNAMMHVIIEEGLVDHEFVRTRTTGFDALKQTVKAYSPEAMEHVTGIAASEIRAAARLYATAGSAMIFWGMGISQHVHGTDNARCLISLALMTGQIGRRGTGLHPLRGQNNVQGASDMGLIPMVYPDYRSCNDAAVRADFAKLWDEPDLDPKAGLTVVEIMKAAKRHEIRAMYIMGENPAMSDPDVQHAREAIALLDWLVVQDLFLTETASFADVILPASAFPEKTGTFTNTDRRVQLGRQALEPPGQARQDLWIIEEIARRVGLEWDYAGPHEVWAEIRRAVPSCAGITWERLEHESSVTYPCRNEGDPGEEVLFVDDFPTKDGLAKFVPAEFGHAEGDEHPDEAYPFVLITGRVLEHWHTGAMTRRASVLDAIEPVPTVSLCSTDMDALGIASTGSIRLTTRRGELVALARRDDSIPRGAVFIPFCYVEAAANLLTNPALDPFGKIPEFKYCGVRVEPASQPIDTPRYGVAAEVGTA